MKIVRNIRQNIYQILAYHWDETVDLLKSEVVEDLFKRVWDILGNEKGSVLPILEKNNSHFLFHDLLDVLNENFRFADFIPILLDPVLFENPQEFRVIYSQVNVELDKTEYTLSIKSINENGYQIFEVVKRKYRTSIPNGVSENTIPFYVSEQPKDKDLESEYFILNPNLRWNDYSVVSIFGLSYVKDGKHYSIGSTKIIHRVELDTWKAIPSRFTSLEGTFCSLSSNEDFYYDLKEHFGLEKTISILYALQDAGFFLDIQENFAYTSNYVNSLIRTDGGERMARKARQILLGPKDKNPYSFSYHFTPNYSEESIEVNFGFNNDEPVPERIFAVIGKNGTGKTQLLTKLPADLAKGNKNLFNQKAPSFSKIIAVSFSPFDNFEIPEASAKFSYSYSGLKQDDGQLQSDNYRLQNFYTNWEKIVLHERVPQWRSFLLSFISEDIVNEILPVTRNYQLEKIDIRFDVIKRKLSSGQSILLNIVTEIIAKIRYDALIIYDEPETHLHPNAITELMSMIYELVEEFDSYCLIATHSPFVVRELFSKNVFVLEKLETIPSIRRIGIESFGENISVITDDVFGDANANKPYRGIISRLVEDGNSFDEIVDILEFDEIPLSLNTKLFIRSLIGNKA